MGRSLLISVDGACSGRRAACAAVLSGDGKIVEEASRALPQVNGYVLGAEIAGVALAGEFFVDDEAPRVVTVEIDNPDVPRVIEDNYKTRQFARIPTPILEATMCASGCSRVTALSDCGKRTASHPSDSGPNGHEVSGRVAKEAALKDWNVVVTVFDQDAIIRSSKHHALD